MTRKSHVWVPVAIGIGFLIALAIAAVPGIVRSRRISKMKLTMQRLRDIGTALEKSFVEKGMPLPCIRTRVDFPNAAAARLPPETFLDGWNREILVRSSPRRYVVMSVGGDGERDGHYDTRTFDGADGDIVFSNGEFVHFPNGVVTLYTLVPQAPDAIAEASDCTRAPTSFDPCPLYLYLPTEAQARAAAADAAKQGFTVEVRRAMNGEWLCHATKRMDCLDADDLLFTIEKVHGGYARHARDPSHLRGLP